MDTAEMVGQPVARVEGRAKVTGRTLYTADASVENVAFAVLVQATVPHGRVTQANFEAALAQPGVLYLLSPDNCPKLHELPAELTRDLPAERRPPLCDWEIHYAGQHLALVVAESQEQAEYAASLIRFDYEAEPADLALEASLHDRRPVINQGQIQRGAYQPDHFTRLEAEKLQYTRGERPGTGSIAAQVAETWTTPVEHHNPIELSATLASWQGDCLTVRDTTRWLLGSRKALAAYFDLPEDSVRVLCPFIGGAFGAKGFLWQHVALAAVAARELKRPVKLVLTRAQMYTSTGHRPRTIQQVTLAADAAGRLLSTEHHTLTETSTVAHFTEPAGLHSRNLYLSPHAAITHTVARTHLPTPVFMRAPGEAPGLFALECAMDELAYSSSPPSGSQPLDSGTPDPRPPDPQPPDAQPPDPLELRLRNKAHHDQDGDKPYAGKRLRDCYLLGAERFGWASRPPAPRSLRREGKLVGQGMATATYPGRRMAASASATLTVDGQLTIRVATHELGNGVRTVLAQIAADASGLPFEAVSVLTGDSAFPPAPYTGASQTTATTGPAVQAAANALRGRLVALATTQTRAPFHCLPPQVLTLKQGSLEHGVHRLDYRTLIAHHGQSLCATVEASPPDNMEDVTHQSFGAHFVEVEVDETLGLARVVRWVGVFDGGRILNPRLARSQVMGAIVFAIGMTLMEETLYDRGLPLNANLADYHVPTNADVPALDMHFIEQPDLQLNPLGARGIGELGIVGAPAAIANALFHATGRRFRRLPIKVEDLLTTSQTAGVTFPASHQT